MNRPVEKTHPMFGVATAWMLADIRLQMDPFKSQILKTEVIVATSDESKLVGFMTFTRANNSPTACGINYICVDSKCRSNGLMRAMIDIVKSKYSDIALACFPELVMMYEKLGFVMCEAQGAQVSMRIGGAYIMNKIKPEIISNEQDVAFESSLLIKENGKKKALKIDEMFDAETYRISQKVELFVQSRRDTAKI